MDIKTAMKKITMRADGVDHLWVSPFATSQLGKIVSMKWRKKFFIPMLGEFVSPDAFCSWLFTGEESERQNPAAKIPQLSKEEFKLARTAMFFAKYHQLTALKPALIKECKAEEGKKSVLELPWFEYKLHLSGIKEQNQDTKRVSIVKDMVIHLIKNGSKTPFKNDDFNYVEAKQQIMDYIHETFEIVEGNEEVQEEAES